MNVNRLRVLPGIRWLDHFSLEFRLYEDGSKYFVTVCLGKTQGFVAPLSNSVGGCGHSGHVGEFVVIVGDRTPIKWQI